MTPLPLSDCYSARGGARFGWVNVGWPMAKLQVSGEELTISTATFWFFKGERYTFVPSQVTAITRYDGIPFLTGGVHIQHTVAEYPQRIVFMRRAGPVLAGIASTGFVAQAPPEAQAAAAKMSGAPYRWVTVAALIVIWNLVCLSQVLPLSSLPRFPGPPMVALLALFSALALGTLRFPWLQSILLKPGRHIGEVRLPLLFVGALLGVMALAFSLRMGVGR